MKNSELTLNIIKKDNVNILGYKSIKQLSKLLAYSEPERIDDFYEFWKNWFEDKIPGEKFTVIMSETKNSEVIGVVRFWKSPYCNNKWLIEGLEVIENKRRLGIGSKLVKEGIKNLILMKVPEVYVHIKNNNYKSINLHLKLDFKEISKGSRNSFGNYNDNINEYVLNL